jgi:DNA-binding beta-propeller fold protein YncE
MLVLLLATGAYADGTWVAGRLVGELPASPRLGGFEGSRNGCPIVTGCSTEADSPAGVAWDGTHAWVGYSEAQPTTIDKINLACVDFCCVLHSIPAPGGGYIGGLASDGTNLWCLAEQDGIIYKLDPADGAILDQFNAPSFGEGDPNGSGLAWDGQYLWHADYGHDTIYKLDPANGGNVITSFPAPGTIPGGLGYCSGTLVNADINPPTIYEINPSDGSVINSCAAVDTHPWGVAVGASGVWSAELNANALYLLGIALGPSAVQNSTWGTIKALYR